MATNWNKQIPWMGSIHETAAAQVLSVYRCPKKGCMRVLQCHVQRDRHLFYEQCPKEADQASQGYAVNLIEGAGVRRTLHQAPDTTATRTTPLKEGWAPKLAKKPYRFNTAKKDFLTFKFNIDQEAGLKQDADVFAREMQKARDMNDKRLFPVSEFPTPLPTPGVVVLFSRFPGKVRQQPAVSEEPSTEGLDDMDRDAAAGIEEKNFSQTRETVMESVHLVHPIICDHYNVFDMVNTAFIKKEKLGVLPFLCYELGVDAQVPRVRKKAVHLTLLGNLVEECTCNITTR